MKKLCLFLICCLFMFFVSTSEVSADEACTKEAAMQLAKIVYREVGATNDMFVQLTTASVILNNASSKPGSNWYNKMMNLTDNNYGGYSSYRDLSFDTVVTNYKGRMLYIAELVLNGKYSLPDNMVLQASETIVNRWGKVWTHVDASPYNIYFGYSGNTMSNKDVFGRNVKNTSVAAFKTLAKSLELSSYDEYTTSSVCGGLSDNISGTINGNSNDNNEIYIDIPVCENPDILKVIYFASIIVDIVKIIIPIGLIVMGMIDFSKGVTSSNDGDNKKNMSRLIKRFVYAVLVFAVPWIVKIVIINLGNLAEGVNFTDCLENADGDKIKVLEEKYKDLENNAIINHNLTNFTYDKVIFVGDSRTYQMCFSVAEGGNTTNCSFKGNGNKPFVSGSYYYIAEGSMGYTWFEETAVPEVNKIINSSNDRYAIVSLMGVNGVLGDISNYINKYMELSNTYWSNHKIVLVSVMPVNDNDIKNYKNIVNNKNIEEFNNRLKKLSASNITYCDIYTTMKSNMNKYKLRDDGLHYTTDGYKEIYKLIEEKCF